MEDTRILIKEAAQLLRQLPKPFSRPWGSKQFTVQHQDGRWCLDTQKNAVFLLLLLLKKVNFLSCGGCGRISTVVRYQFREDCDSVVWHACMAYGIISTKNFIYVQRTMHKYPSEYYNSKHFEVISPGLVVMRGRHGNRIIYACKNYIGKTWENWRRIGTFAEFLDQVKLCQPSTERKED